MRTRATAIGTGVPLSSAKRECWTGKANDESYTVNTNHAGMERPLRSRDVDSADSGGIMPSRTVAWTLAILAVVLVVVPLLTTLGMMACCGGMGMGGMMSGSMMGMSLIGLIWMLLAAAIVIALVVLLIRGVTRV